MQGYLHDSNFSSAKDVKAIRNKLGLEAELVFRLIIEWLSSTNQKHLSATNEQSKVISDSIKIDQSKVRFYLNSFRNIGVLKEDKRNGKNTYYFPFYDKIEKYNELNPLPQKKLDHPLNDWISENCPLVSRISRQLTASDCDELIEKHSEEMIKRLLYSMDNQRDVFKKYTSVKATLINRIHYDGVWSKKDDKELSKEIKSNFVAQIPSKE